MNARVAVVGAGYFAAFHLEAWRALGVRVERLCDIDLGRAQALAARFGVPAVADRVQAVLDGARPDLVDVVLPPQAQAGVVQMLLQARLPVVCQEPSGEGLAQAAARAAMAQAQRTPLVGHENFRFMPWFRECRRLIDAGHFGRLHGITFRLRPGDGQDPSAYLDRQPYFRTMPRLLVRETAVHFIDTFRYLCGEVRAVTARLRRLNPALAGEDAALIVMEFDGDVTGVFDGNRLNDHVAADPRRTMGEMWLEGERGVMRLDGDGRLWWKPHHGPEAEHRFEHAHPGVFGGAVAALQAHVLAHLRDGAPLENGAHDYLANLRVQEAVYASHAGGRRVPLGATDPDRP